MEFSSKRPTKWEKEQAERRKKALVKREAEKRNAERYEAQKKEVERLAELRRIEEEKLAEEREAARLEEEAQTQGISLNLSLRPVRLNEAEDDKVS